MSNLETLQAVIQSPALKIVFAHWLDARKERLMPAWKDIDAAAIGKYLPMVWAWRFDTTQDTFIGRLAGEDITAVLGYEIRGRPMKQCFPPMAFPTVEARHRKVIGGPCIMRTTGQVYVQTGRHGGGERIVLPLSEDGVTGDGVLGVTEYHLNIAEARSMGAAIDHAHEEVVFYPLV
ncbi:MAG TPA: PAS domain-containing protein [Aliidongia sp.]|uniref:PAS domain-containing protein n=1 Tax=Aliidongia sp. TaxID=1914230 RepID=UPI002DDD50C7|nr:PAS domain-containing protein [Aliidongia sp.]HEV2675812.1 PAS domain-containing protein [Aliidongia sp.]